LKWDAIGAVGEVIGAVAVLITLIYLARQVKENTRISKVSSMQTAVSNYQTHLLPVQQEPLLAELVLKGLGTDPHDPDGLKSGERLRFHFWMSSMILHFMDLMNCFQNGMLDREALDAWHTYTARCLSTKGGKIWWDTNKIIWPSAVHETLDEMVGRVEPIDELSFYFRAGE
jgi:hypothetical protein